MRTDIFIWLCFLSCACSNAVPVANEQIRSMNTPDRPMRILEDLVIREGDIEAYETLETAYLDSAHGRFYKLAKQMADRWDYPRAHYDVYLQILKPTGKAGYTLSLDSCSAAERNEAIAYVKAAYAKGFDPAGEALDQLKEDGYIK